MWNLLKLHGLKDNPNPQPKDPIIVEARIFKTKKLTPPSTNLDQSQEKG